MSQSKLGLSWIVKGTMMFWQLCIAAAVTFSMILSTGNSYAQDSESLFDLAVSRVDDTTCEDGIGRTYRGDTFIAAVQNDTTGNFYARHEACAGLSGVNAQVGMAQYPVGFGARCSAPMTFPGDEYDWVFCALTFTLMQEYASPIHIELDEFFLLTSDGQKLQSYSRPDLYVGQPTDMSGGVDLAGTEPLFGLIVFPAFHGQVEPPFAVWWETTGDVIIADELEPAVAESFLYNAGLTSETSP